MQLFQITDKDLASTRDRSCFSPQFPGSHFQAGCQISIEGQAYVRSKLSSQKYRTTIKIITAHVATVIAAYFDRWTSRLTVSPRPSKRFAERYILIVLSTA